MERFDFEQHGLEGWQSVDGRWGVEEMAGAPSGQRVLVQRAVENAFNVIVAPSASYTDVDVTVRFQPMAGQEDASGGIVFRFAEGHYYVVRANALENNFRLYYYDRGRHQVATARVQPPALNQWHTIRGWRWGSTSRPLSTASSFWIIGTRAIARGRSACGPRPTP